MEILGKTWFTNRDGTTGIVRVRMDNREIKYFISHVDGIHEDHDAEQIASWGSTFPGVAGDALFGID